MVDYTREDLTPSGETYDVIFDTVGNLSESQGKRALKTDGIYLNVHKRTIGKIRLGYSR